MNLGESIYNHRTRCHLSQGEMADALNISRQSVSKWENNVAVPELDKLIKMAELFGVSLDALVYGEEPAVKEAETELETTAILPAPVSMRTTVGLVFFIFGLLGFLLSVFFGDRLRVGEEIGEIVSVCMVVLGVSMIATYQFKILALMGIISFMYSVVCLGFFDFYNLYNYAFIFFTNLILLVWFIILGLHANRGKNES